MRRTRVTCGGIALALLVLAGPARVFGQAPSVRPAAALAATPAPAPTSEAAPAPEPPAETPDSPRASARTFFQLTAKKGDFTAAARYLSLQPDFANRGPDLARRIAAVIEQQVVFDLDSLSPLPNGNENDGLPRHVERVGTVLDASGSREPVYIVRRVDKDGAFWAFSHDTVSRIDGWYDALPDRWVRDWMPEPLQRHGPFGLLWWQWLALPLLALCAFAVGRLVSGLAMRVLGRVFTRTRTKWDEHLLDRVEPAVRLLAAVVTAAVLLPFLALLPAAEGRARLLLGALATVSVFWALLRSVDVWLRVLVSRPWVADSPSTRSLIEVGVNFVRILVVVTGALAVLAVFGYPVTTVVAGLGIGGIALAFGAQKTVENLFGSVALAVDQPFRVGDFVKIEDFTGNVERIGMRSTQVRTLDRTTVTLPNGKLSELKIEGFGTRDRIRFATTVGLVYGTTEAQVRQVVLEIERLLRGVPEIWPDTIVAKFSALGHSSLDVEVMCWFQTADYDAFRRIRQDVLLGILKVVEEAGTSIAFPTRTVHVETAAQVQAPGGPVPGPGRT